MLAFSRKSPTVSAPVLTGKAGSGCNSLGRTDLTTVQTLGDRWQLLCTCEVELNQPPGQEENVALRADSARHFIMGATILIFSAAVIGTAMRYQDTRPASDLILAAELPARQAPNAAH